MIEGVFGLAQQGQPRLQTQKNPKTIVTRSFISVLPAWTRHSR